MEYQKTSLSDMTDEEQVYSVIKDCWRFMKKNLRGGQNYSADDWNNVINTELNGILLPYYKTPMQSFATGIFTAALVELERRCKTE